MIVLKAPSAQIPMRLLHVVPLSTAPVAIPPKGWSRTYFASTGGWLGAQADKAAAEKSQKIMEAGSDLWCDSLEIFSGTSSAALRSANANSMAANFPATADAGAFDPTKLFTKDFLDGAGQIMDSLDPNPLSVSISICIATTQTFRDYMNGDIDGATASLAFGAASLDAAGLIATACGYKAVSNGLTTAGFAIRSGKNTRILWQNFA